MSRVRPVSSATPTVIQVAAGLIFRRDQLLITQRRQQDHLGGLWEFPGGKRHPGETFAVCLARELREELGIDVDVGELFETIRHDYPDKRVLLKFYLCRWRRCEPQALGCARFAWIQPHELNQYAFPAADAKLLARLMAENETGAKTNAKIRRPKATRSPKSKSKEELARNPA